jgi:two-component system, OmpR family, sensor histidine kinase KdpD
VKAAAGRAAPYALGAAGVAVITAGIGLLRPWVDIPNLTVAYLLLVLWLGARYGLLPALAAAVLAFLVYEILFVPPYGTLLISAPHDLLNLLVLLLAAIAGGRLVSGVASARVRAEALALESGTLYQVAVEALRGADFSTALSLLCDRAAATPGVSGFAVLAADVHGLTHLAGSPPTADELTSARWTAEHQTPVGAMVRGGSLDLVRPVGAETAAATVPMTGGVALVRYRPGAVDERGQHALLALVGLGGLLLDRRRALAEGERARGLEASDRLKAAVLSSLSHELKSPLATIRAGLTTLGMKEAGLEPDQQAMVEGLDVQARRLDGLVRDLLVMSRLEAGVTGERAPEDLAALVGAVVQALGARLAGHPLEIEIPADLPPVLGDELQLDQVFTNLLENAVEWTAPGGRIAIGARRAGDEVEAWVENTGPDIPPTELASIFDTFWSGRSGGTGLGLAICRRIVEANGGHIRATNRRGGPRFTFTLPIATAAVAPTG